MDDAIKQAILRNLTKEDIMELFDQQETVKDETFLQNPIPPEQKYYISRTIPGSIRSCGTCGQSLVNDEDHAIELLGGENN